MTPSVMIRRLASLLLEGEPKNFEYTELGEDEIALVQMSVYIREMA